SVLPLDRGWLTRRFWTTDVQLTSGQESRGRGDAALGSSGPGYSPRDQAAAPRPLSFRAMRERREAGEVARSLTLACDKLISSRARRAAPAPRASTAFDADLLTTP